MFMGFRMDPPHVIRYDELLERKTMTDDGSRRCERFVLVQVCR
jgi:hypothetical protein